MTPKKTSGANTAKTGFTAMNPGERVHWLLVVRRLTQSELAGLAGVSQSTISNIIRLPARQPSASTLLALSTALECDPRFIVEGTPAPKISGLREHHIEHVDALELLTLFERLGPQRRLQLLVLAKALAGTRPLS